MPKLTNVIQEVLDEVSVISGDIEGVIDSLSDISRTEDVEDMRSIAVDAIHDLNILKNKIE